MGRAKKKQAAALRQQQDFQKKKAKLGVKTRPDNRTDVSVHTRHIHVPLQHQDPSTSSSSLHQASLHTLLKRTTHHHVVARTNALHAIRTSLQQQHDDEHDHSSHLHAILSASAVALSDSHASVRTAASHCLLTALALVPRSARVAHAATISAHTLSALTHLKRDVSSHSARFLVSLCGTTPTGAEHHNSSDMASRDVEMPLMDVHELFPEFGANLFAVFVEMLRFAEGSRHRIDALVALSVILSPTTTTTKTTTPPATGPPSQHRLFLYHQSESQALKKKQTRASGWDALHGEMGGRLVSRVADVVMEAVAGDGALRGRPAEELAAGMRVLSLAVESVGNGGLLHKKLRNVIERCVERVEWIGDWNVCCAIARVCVRVGLLEHCGKMLRRATDVNGGVSKEIVQGFVDGVSQGAGEGLQGFVDKVLLVEVRKAVREREHEHVGICVLALNAWLKWEMGRKRGLGDVGRVLMAGVGCLQIGGETLNEAVQTCVRMWEEARAWGKVEETRWREFVEMLVKNGLKQGDDMREGCVKELVRVSVVEDLLMSQMAVMVVAGGGRTARLMLDALEWEASEFGDARRARVVGLVSAVREIAAPRRAVGDAMVMQMDRICAGA